MFPQAVFLLPPALTAVAVYCVDIVRRIHILNAFIFVLIASSAIYGLCHPPFHNALANYANGFMLSWYLIWSVNILFVCDVRSLRRLRSTTVQGCDFCHWEPLRDTTAVGRIAWALDLSTNFRGLGWMSAETDASWPPAKYRWRPAPAYGLSQRFRRLIADAVIFVFAWHVGNRSSASVYRRCSSPPAQGTV